MISKNKCIDEFVELTRQYDTWEGKTIYNNKKARMLHILFEQLGIDKYINKITNIVKFNENFEFDDYEIKIINEFNKNLEETLNTIVKDMFVLDIEINNIKYKVGFIKSPYKYRNDLNEIIIKNNINDIVLIGIIITDKYTVSYRQIKNIDVSKITCYFGGSGHKEAASSPKNNEDFLKIANI